MRSRRQRSLSRESQTRNWAHCLIRSTLLSDDEALAEISAVIAVDLPKIGDARVVAEAWIAEERAEWARDAASWPAVTDYDRLQAAFARLGPRLPILIGCEDHWAASAALAALPASVEGLLWNTPMDLWHAVDEPMLEVNIWDRRGINQGGESPLVALAIKACEAEGLEAHIDEGRLEIAARWQRRP